MTRKHVLALGLLGTLAVFTGSRLLAPVTSTASVEKVFVCEADGELTEQHVGVDSAYTRKARQWNIRYTDGQRAVYQQADGETCRVEIVVSQVKPENIEASFEKGTFEDPIWEVIGFRRC